MSFWKTIFGGLRTHRPNSTPSGKAQPPSTAAPSPPQTSIAAPSGTSFLAPEPQRLANNQTSKEDRPIGWVDCSALRRAGGGEDEIWKPEYGFQYLLFLIATPTRKRYLVQFDASLACLYSASGESAKACGVVPCLNRDFRSRDGQAIPLLIPTNLAKFEQEAECFGVLFCVPKTFVPKRLEHNGIDFSDLEKLGVSDHPSKGPSTVLTMRSECTLRSQILFSFKEEAMRGFTLFQAPSSREGIVAIGPRAGYSIVVFRIPFNLVEKVESEEIRAFLRDGSVLQASGLILDVSMPGLTRPTPALVDKAALTPRGKTLKAGGTAKILSDYVGPTTYFDDLDCKIAAAFESRADWQATLSIEVRNYKSKFENGTLVYDAPSHSPARIAAISLAEPAVNAEGPASSARPTLPPTHSPKEAMILAAKQGRAADLRVLAAQDPSLIQTTTEDGMGLLSHAAWFGHFDTVVALLDLGADVDGRNNIGVSAIHFAAGKDRAEVIKLLVERGAKIDDRTNDKFTPLHTAALNHATTAVELLLQLGADVNARGVDGTTPLHSAREKRDLAVEQVLRRHGGTS